MYSQAQIDPLLSFRGTHGEAVRAILKLQRKSLAMAVYHPDAIRPGGKAVLISMLNAGLTAPLPPQSCPRKMNVDVSNVHPFADVRLP